MFKHLRTKLTVLYVALFAASLAMIALAVYVAATHQVEQNGAGQLATSGTIFDNLLVTRDQGLKDEASILAHDYGFRAAVATGDSATVRSALDNLAGRLGIDMAFVVDMDGHVTQQDATRSSLPPQVVRSLQAADTVAGLFNLGGAAYEAVSAPILTPVPAGWVVFATRVDRHDMARLERLSAIPLQAAVLGRRGDGTWVSLDASHPLASSPALQALISRSIAGRAAGAMRLADGRTGSLALVRPLTTLGDAQDVMVLRYPLADAFKPFHTLFSYIFLIGASGVLLLVIGSWLIARTVTRPISELEEAARRLQRGETARVPSRAGDEIARLGSSFNAMADDIQEREARLREARDMAEAADRAKTEFLANMNHEFRTPLNGVLGTASVLSDTVLDTRQRKMVDIIEMSGQGLKRILNDVLDMVEIGSGQISLRDAPFDLGATIRMLARDCAEAAAAKGVAFHLDLAMEADRWVGGDEARVAQILDNLLTNAVKFTARGEIALSVRAGEAGYRFEVRDTGIGFDPRRIEEMFQPFSQADGSMTRQFGGTGLGLSLSRGTARAMGGDIAAHGSLGRGACFVATLPLAEAAAPAPALETQVPDEGRPGDDAVSNDAPLRILLAEDHPANRAVVELILGAIGVDLVAVENGAEAVEAFKTREFDIVLMDLQMPVMDGLTAIRRIREHEGARQHTPILVLSANVQVEHLAASAAAGADNHLAKPIVAPTLIAALEEALDQRDYQDSPTAIAC